MVLEKISLKEIFLSSWYFFEVGDLFVIFFAILMKKILNILDAVMGSFLVCISCSLSFILIISLSLIH